jgi:uncharacterized membrane protein
MMEKRKFKPWHGIVLVLVFMAAALAADHFVTGEHRKADYERVRPGTDGLVRISVADLKPAEVRFYHFLNPANQEVHFFLARDEKGTLVSAFDANEICYKKKRGYRWEGEWVTCNFCDKSFRLAEVNQGGGGCKPVPMVATERNGEVVLDEATILQGWRYFR